MPDYHVYVTYKVGRGQRNRTTRGYVVEASSKAEAEQKGRRAHQRQGEPGTPIAAVRAERL